MSMFVLFGVKDTEIGHVDEAARSVEQLIGVPPVKRTGNEKGHYCTFDSGADEEIEVVSGTYGDEDGEYPAECEFPNWKFLVYLNYTSETSVWLKVLENASDAFQKLRSDVFG